MVVTNLELNNIPEAFQTKLRLMIISALCTGEKTFKDLKNITGATDGNISVQISKLEELGYLSVSKEFVGRKTKTTCKISEIGFESFTEYVNLLDKILLYADENSYK